MTSNRSPTRTHAERLSELISQCILDGDFAPGTHLDENLLATRFGVSRTPVRDALRLLSGTGLIDLRHNRGAWIRALSQDEIAMLFAAMAEIEASCARLAANAMSEAERSKLWQLHVRMQDMVSTDDQASYIDANRCFHQAIYSGAHNKVLAETAISLRRRLMPYRVAQFGLPGRLVQSHFEHARVLKTIQARDGTGANFMMLAHLLNVEEAFETRAAITNAKEVAEPNNVTLKADISQSSTNTNAG